MWYGTWGYVAVSDNAHTEYVEELAQEVPAEGGEAAALLLGQEALELEVGQLSPGFGLATPKEALQLPGIPLNRPLAAALDLEVEQPLRISGSSR